jgi:hypothetical protein
MPGVRILSCLAPKCIALRPFSDSPVIHSRARLERPPESESVSAGTGQLPSTRGASRIPVLHPPSAGPRSDAGPFQVRTPWSAPCSCIMTLRMAETFTAIEIPPLRRGEHCACTYVWQRNKCLPTNYPLSYSVGQNESRLPAKPALRKKPVRARIHSNRNLPKSGISAI